MRRPSLTKRRAEALAVAIDQLRLDASRPAMGTGKRAQLELAARHIEEVLEHRVELQTRQLIAHKGAQKPHG